MKRDDYFASIKVNGQEINISQGESVVSPNSIQNRMLLQVGPAQPSGRSYACAYLTDAQAGKLVANIQAYLKLKK